MNKPNESPLLPCRVCGSCNVINDMLVDLNGEDESPHGRCLDCKACAPLVAWNTPTVNLTPQPAVSGDVVVKDAWPMRSEAMREFIASDYSPHSGWTKAQYTAAQESTAHWLKYEDVMATPPLAGSKDGGSDVT